MKKEMEDAYDRNSQRNHDGPAHALVFREGAAKRWVRGALQAGIQLEMGTYRGADVLWISGRQHRWRRFREPSTDPAGSKNPSHAPDLFMLRTGRSHGHPPVVMEGRVVRGRLRP